VVSKGNVLRLLFALFLSVLIQQVAVAEFEIFVTSGLSAPEGNGMLSLPNAPAINAAGDLAFVSQLTGTSGGTSDNQGLYRYTSGGLTKIARTGESMIGRTITFLFPASIESSGVVGGIPALSGPPTLVWYLRGDGGPLVSPFTLGSLGPSGNNTLFGVTTTAVNDAGYTAFRAIYTGTPSEAGIYLRSPDGTIQTRLLQQSTAPRGGTISSAGIRLAINESNEVATLLRIDSSFESVALVDASGADEFAREGDVLTGGVTIDQISSTLSFVTDPIPVINDVGQVAFPARYTLPAQRMGVFLADENGTQLLTPNVLPSGGTYPSAVNVVGLSNSGSVTFAAEFPGPSADSPSGIYWANNSTTQLVAFEDTATPMPGKFFRSFPTTAITSNAEGEIAFLAELSDTANGAAAGKGLYYYDPQNGLKEILRTGDAFGGSTVTNLLFFGTFINNISNQSPDTSNSGFNADGEVAFAFDLANGQSGVAIWSDSLAGDFDEDGDVDGRDFLVWQRNSNVGDLADWSSSYGAGTLGAVTAIPEPSSLVMFLIAAYGLAARIGFHRDVCPHDLGAYDCG
jgi:hypothetical protein